MHSLMNEKRSKPGVIARREFIASALVALAAGFTKTSPVLAAEKKRQPMMLADDKPLSAIGMGTWLTFDVTEGSADYAERRKVLDAFHLHGGSMIDSSPMYGRSEQVVGSLLEAHKNSNTTSFSATKIWTVVSSRGPKQLQKSHALWRTPTLDLVYVHNLLNWKAHLRTLRAAKERGTVRYIGLTTSHGRRHDDMEQLIQQEPVDAVQFTYNVLDRNAEKRLLPAAQDQGVNVVINRPFRTGRLFKIVTGHPLPPFASELNCTHWAQVFLKFILSHPAVDYVIPATRRVDHMLQNMQALKGPLPDAAMRRAIVNYVERL